jgi:FkbM family methyltransferase
MKFFLKSQTPNERYSFNVKWDQFGNVVHRKSIDTSEKILIDAFEKIILELLRIDKDVFTMIELGSNQCYYSIMFKAMCKHFKKSSDVFLVEPNPAHLSRGMENFSMNNYNGYFNSLIIGEKESLKEDLDVSSLPGGSEYLFGCKVMTIPFRQFVKNNLNENCVEGVDILHMDVDFAEMSVLESGKELFADKFFKNVFISTHSVDLHNRTKNFMLGYGYNLIHEETNNVVGNDRLLVFSA